VRPTTNAGAIAEFAEEAGAEVLRGDLQYRSYSGGRQLDDIGFREHLGRYRHAFADLPALSYFSLTHSRTMSFEAEL
jgi:hypothetical protein